MFANNNIQYYSYKTAGDNSVPRHCDVTWFQSKCDQFTNELNQLTKQNDRLTKQNENMMEKYQRVKTDCDLYKTEYEALKAKVGIQITYNTLERVHFNNNKN